MALVDKLLQFSDKQAIAAGASTFTLDTVHKSVGTAGLPICLQGHVVGPANATVTVTLEESADDTTFTAAAASKVFKAAELNKGTFFYVNSATKRFIRLSYAVANAPTGSISAWLGNEADIRTNYDAVSGATVPV
ncbi:TPA: Bbp16 family capsid cement protein [Acinetobacter baumannii]|uniref:Bbp16 family capsid cement protein n=1 Tax=Acinetobacter baumannii TaxID=470 RepID=UPI00192A8CCA|nr:hypothetical protein [Acinetobacter baumannii]EKV3837090.1 hypothetical protein [Acinetobacter baumannii]EKV6048988.1 hypothetical protein [Acinetobacter baumannii]ELY3911566.1 hypothetical protein [Acinetobacter baumannii]MDP7959948.1 hypothetical protein [Acinetobacter baumannii]HAV4611873.1 hypothetical protein [Acinetobacter baumannii]